MTPSAQKVSMRIKLTAAALLLATTALGGLAQAQVKESNGGPPNYDAGYTATTQAHAATLAHVTPVTDETLRHPGDGDWLGWRRTNAALGFSPLKEINRDDAHGLGVAWTWTLPVSPNEITPLAHDGVLYVASADSVQALDGATGDLLWEYKRPMPAEMHDGAKSIVKNLALYDGKVFAPTPDGHMVALDARTGAVVWDHTILGFEETSNQLKIDGGPVVAHGKVVQGISNCATYEGGCFIVALDAATGAEAWRFHTIARPGQPGGDSWNGAPLSERFGGSVWTSGSYDPDLDLVYFGVGQTYDAATLLQPHPQKGQSADALYTDSTLALRPETGELVWYFQHFKRDVWDMDWVFEQSLVDAPVDGRARKLLVTSGKIGIVDVIDRTNGAYVASYDLGLQNLVSHVDPRTGDKTINPAFAPAPDVTQHICPHSGGARSWPATAYDPANHLLFVPMVVACMDFTWNPGTPMPTAAGGKDINWVLQPPPASDGNFGRVQALDIQTGKIAWIKRRRAPQTSSILATAGDLIFEGDRDRYFRASDAETGAVLWETRLNAIVSSTPVTYTAEGEQYVAVVAGGGGGHAETWTSLAPEIKTPDGGTTLWVFKLTAHPR